jgi:plasmid maintenance system killer protein
MLTLECALAGSVSFTYLVNTYGRPVPLEVYFQDQRLKRVWESDRDLRRKFGQERAKKIMTRTAQLRAADTLADLRGMPGRWHELTQDKGGIISADLDGPYRLLVEPTEWHDSLTPEGSLDWGKVTAVIIVGIEDTH